MRYDVRLSDSQICKLSEKKEVLLKWRTCEFSCVKSWFEFFKALCCHWMNFQKQYSKMFPRYQPLTYVKGSFGHQLLNYQLYDLLYTPIILEIFAWWNYPALKPIQNLLVCIGICWNWKCANIHFFFFFILCRFIFSPNK